jgi:hypothetical protein
LFEVARGNRKFQNGGYIAVGVPLLAAAGIAVVGLAGAALASGAGVLPTVGGPLGGVYTAKVIAQMAQRDYHGFPLLMDRLVQDGDQAATIGNDGQAYTQINLPGCINGVKGTFQWIMAHGNINHRFFQPED